MAHKIVEGLLYTESDEWVRVEGEIAIVGITDYAQDKLGDIVYIEEAVQGNKVVKEDKVATIESVKAASDINAPVSGEIVEVNKSVVKDPAIVNNDPYSKGWLFKIKIDNTEEIKDLLNAKGYEEYRKE
ncbi:MAG: glycine cleavage system protein H [Caldiserica bacterium CG02_land_8_20_14_3_00_36_38]|nr:glycine cleavage system protein GcvH [Caldisericota bacterium]OIP12285.1 MAG: glycine cleavage system protein H [Caldisericum sp. CG2_30_36_11]PIP49982.1 MAG: glycine cleavage system protein H [Caldiserica bacterium CG23_combo_of_CG06-09_8_20_14_all_35_60]PIV54612.1 MAG: glycine cleavage system protein H [Caldiserica bacterium CG02_land_8_20_14_3_00_36_38]PIX29562.1 MAG: glycine cleavage system protein H [Caldiserica bacterium CG_4_8_14_3_um_filter_35_18]